VLVWQTYKVPEEYQHFASQIMTQNDFMKFTITDHHMDELANRMAKQQPGHAVSLVYSIVTKLYQRHHWQPQGRHAQPRQPALDRQIDFQLQSGGVQSCRRPT
jgi:hypothetical protein